MTHAAIVGWGKCLPPSILTNRDLATFLPTDDEWITTRTGMKERRISHVPGIELAITASRRAIACAGMRGEDIELVIYGSCSNDETVPNSASGVQQRIRATHAASFDVNTACTSFMYGLSIGSSMIKSGIVKNALVIGVELISQYLDWDNRNVAVLFGDGAAAMVLQESEQETGVIAEKIECDLGFPGRKRGMLVISPLPFVSPTQSFAHHIERQAPSQSPGHECPDQNLRADKDQERAQRIGLQPAVQSSPVAGR